MIGGLAPRLVAAPGVELPLDRELVRRYLGYRPGRTVSSDRAEAAVDEGIALARRALAPRAALIDCALAAAPAAGRVALVSGLAWQSRQLARALRGAGAVTLVAATVGPGVEEQVRALFAAQEYALATVVDAAGSAAVHAWMARLTDEIGARAKAVGLAAGSPIGPGYGDWAVEDTSGLLAATGAAAIGLTGNESCCLLPEKSAVAVVGWMSTGPAPLVGCAACTMRGCRYRQAPLATGAPGRSRAQKELAQ